MMYRTLVLGLLGILLSFSGTAQIKVSEDIKRSSIASNTNYKLYFVDFWATWCGPCITVSKYLTGLQRQYPEDFYIMSLSQENPDVVKRFVSKHNLELAVAIDYEGGAFTHYNVTSLPHGILLNAQGEKLWEGHPAEFKWYHLKRFLKQQKTSASIDEMFLVQAYETPVDTTAQVAYDFKGHIEVDELPQEEAFLSALKKTDYLEVTGSLRAILAYTHHIFEERIEVPEDLNKTYRVRFKYNTRAYENKTKAVLKYLKLKQSHKDVEGELLYFNLENSHFWDVNQINWGDDTPNFLVGETEIQADDVSLSALNYKLANLLEMPILTNNKELLNELHDWNVHYKYFDLMASAMEDTYGIKIEKKVGTYRKYKIRD